MIKTETFNLLNKVLPYVEKCDFQHFKNEEEKEKLVEYIRVQIALHVPFPKKRRGERKYIIDKEEIQEMLSIEKGLKIEDFAKILDLDISVFSSANRKRDYVDARMFSMAYMYGQGFSYYYISKIHNKNHSTVMHAIKTVKRLIESRDKMTLRILAKLRYERINY